VSWAAVDGDELPFGLADLANDYTALGYSVGYGFADERRGHTVFKVVLADPTGSFDLMLAMTAMKRGPRSNIAVESASRYPEGKLTTSSTRAGHLTPGEVVQTARRSDVERIIDYHWSVVDALRDREVAPMPHDFGGAGRRYRVGLQEEFGRRAYIVGSIRSALHIPEHRAPITRESVLDDLADRFE
jgi:hypothetical protein